MAIQPGGERHLPVLHTIFFQHRGQIMAIDNRRPDVGKQHQPQIGIHDAGNGEQHYQAPPIDRLNPGTARTSSR